MPTSKEGAPVYTTGPARTDPSFSSWLHIYKDRNDKQMLDDMAGWMNVIAQGRHAEGKAHDIAHRALTEYDAYLRVRDHLDKLNKTLVSIAAQSPVYMNEDASAPI